MDTPGAPVDLSPVAWTTKLSGIESRAGVTHRQGQPGEEEGSTKIAFGEGSRQGPDTLPRNWPGAQPHRVGSYPTAKYRHESDTAPWPLLLIPRPKAPRKVAPQLTPRLHTDPSLYLLEDSALAPGPPAACPLPTPPGLPWEREPSLPSPTPWLTQRPALSQLWGRGRCSGGGRERWGWPARSWVAGRQAGRQRQAGRWAGWEGGAC